MTELTLGDICKLYNLNYGSTKTDAAYLRKVKGGNFGRKIHAHCYVYNEDEVRELTQARPLGRPKDKPKVL